MDRAPAKLLKIELILILVILLAAAFLRFWQLDRIPPGLTHDEANNVHDATAVLNGKRPFYFPVAQGKEPLYLYSVAALMGFFGRSVWAMRLSSSLWGLLLVVLTYAWTRRAFGRDVALLTAAGLAVGFWPVSTSRMGLRAIVLPVMFTVAIYFMWRATGRSLHRHRSDPVSTGRAYTLRGLLWYFTSGLALGATFYTYLASRIMPLVFGLFFLYLWWRYRTGWGLLLTLLVAALVAMPLLLYLDAHPSAEIRIGQLSQPLQALSQGDPGPLLDRVHQTVLMFSFQGDSFVPYNLPGKPLFGPVMSALFYGGLALAVWRWRQPSYILALLWLVVGCGPALVTGIEAANLRAIAAQPVIYVFPALALQAIVLRLHALRGKALVSGGPPGDGAHNTLAFAAHLPANQAPLMLGIVLLFAGNFALTYRDYFVAWANHRDVRAHYHADLIVVARYAQDHPAQVFVVSALFPGEYHDPRIVEAYLGDDGNRLRWADGRQAWVLPADGPVGFILPSAVPLNPVLRSILSPTLEQVEYVTVRAGDFNPGFTVYRWDPDAVLPGEPVAQVGGVLQFLGSSVSRMPVPPGATVELVTTWQVTGRLHVTWDAVLFAQILGPDGKIVAQQDRLDAPSWNWHPGDRFTQLFRIAVPADLAPGAYRLILGAYTRPDRVDAVLAGQEPDYAAMPRLPVMRQGQSSGDWIELAPVEVGVDG